MILKENPLGLDGLDEIERPVNGAMFRATTNEPPFLTSSALDKIKDILRPLDRCYYNLTQSRNGRSPENHGERPSNRDSYSGLRKRSLVELTCVFIRDTIRLNVPYEGWCILSIAFKGKRGMV